MDVYGSETGCDGVGMIWLCCKQQKLVFFSEIDHVDPRRAILMYFMFLCWLFSLLKKKVKMALNPCTCIFV